MTFSRRQLVYFISGITLLKLVCLVIFRPAIGLFEDHDIALNLVRTGEFYIDWIGLRNHTFQFPVYPFLVSLIYRIGGIHPLLVCAFHAGLSAISALMLMEIFPFFLKQFRLTPALGKRQDLIVFFSILLFCLHPGIGAYALLKIHPFSLDLFMLLLPLYVTARYWNRPTSLNLILFYLSCGLAVLTRATLLVSALPFLLLHFRAHSISRTLLMLCGLGFTVSLICAPWLIRNCQQDHVIGFGSVTGLTLWKGSIPASEGSNYLDNGKYCYTLLSPASIDSLTSMTVRQQDDYFKSLYLKNIQSNPMGQARLYLLKLGNFWVFRSQLGSDYGSFARKLILPYLFFYLLSLGLCIYACLRVGKRSLLLLIIPIVLSLEQSFFYVETRHRLITEPFLIFLAVLGLFFLLNFRKLE